MFVQHTFFRVKDESLRVARMPLYDKSRCIYRLIHALAHISISFDIPIFWGVTEAILPKDVSFQVDLRCL